MTKIFLFLIALMALGVLFAGAISPIPEKRGTRGAGKPRKPSEFDRLIDELFDKYFAFYPTFGTAVGFHQYDKLLEDYSKASIDRQMAFAREYLGKFERVNPNDLNAEAAADCRLVIGALNALFLDLEHIRMWEKNPDHYSSQISGSVFVIMSRKFAPASERLRSVIAREQQMPKVLEAARQNLKNPPRVYTEVALEQLPGIVRFFEKDVPDAFKEVRDKKLLAEFNKVNRAVIQALGSYETYLKNELLARSNGDFRIGSENYRKKLLYEEMVDIPFDRLLEIGYADLRRNQQAFRETAAKLDPNRKPEETLAALEKEHPSPDTLLQTFANTLHGLRDFIDRAHIVTIPSAVPPILEETPPFMRALTFASMDTPGPYETKAKEAYFNVTLPESVWTKERIQEHMAAFNYATIISTAIHEAYPGHYTQFLWLQRAPSKVRKLLGSRSNTEGWAHYCEQMMLDEGYGRKPGTELANDKDFLKLRLGQLQDALLRNARYVVGLKMHTGQMTFDEGIEFFIKEGLQTRAVAERETKRGTSDPTYLVYTLGKLEILKLREDYAKKHGTEFQLFEFHKRFLQQGFPPIKIIRRAMLGDESSVL